MRIVTVQIHIAIVILGYSGMRAGELEQLEWKDVLLERSKLGMFHVRRGGSVPSKNKSKEDRLGLNIRRRSVCFAA